MIYRAPNITNKGADVKKIFAITIMFLVICTALSASGTKANNGYTPTTYETLENQGAKDIKWIKIDEDTGAIVFEKAKDGEEQPTEAIGYQYTDSKNKVITCYTTEEQGIIATWINVLADTLDTITFRLVVAIHPFPSVLFQMYDMDAMNTSTSGYTMKSDAEKTGTFNSDYLLISNNYYKTDKLNSGWSVRYAETTANAVSDNYHDYTSYTGTSPYQHAKWSIITVLFITCFVAEMLFMAIYGYITQATDNFLKDIAKKAGITLVLFVLVSALPFLLESMRYGFCTIVDVFYAPVSDSYYSNRSLTNSVSDSGEIFQLPGAFLRQMKVFFTRINSSSTEAALKDKMGSEVTSGFTGAAFFMRLVVWLLMLFFRLIMFFAVLKASLHIAVNIIEVYLLLGLTMILVPFTCFEPLKPLGSKCVMSLVSNLIECFIIMVLVVCVVPTVVSVCNDILDNVAYYQEPETIVSWAEITYKVGGNIYEGTTKSNHTPDSVGIAANSEYIMLYMSTSLKYRVGLLYDFTNNTAGTISEKLQSYMQALAIDYVLVMDSRYPNTDAITMTSLEKNKITLPETDDAYNQKKVFAPASDESGNKKTEAFVSIAKIFYNAIISLRYGRNAKTICTNQAMRQDFVEQVAGKLSKSDSFITNLDTVLSGTLMIKNAIGVETTNDTATFKKFVDVVPYTRENGAVTSTDSTTTHWLGGLLVCFMGMYIPVFFVQQSTQITNALMQGNAGMESFANAMGSMAQSAYSRTKNTMSTAVGALGGAAKSAVQMKVMSESMKNAAGNNNDKKADQSAAEKLNSGD